MVSSSSLSDLVVAARHASLEVIRCGGSCCARRSKHGEAEIKAWRRAARVLDENPHGVH